MDTRRLDLGLVAGLSVQSFGEPGQRTFRLLARTEEGDVSLWLEKEQVVMLGDALEELLTRIPPPGGLDPTRLSSGTPFMGELEARVGSMELGYDRGRDGFSVIAADLMSAMPVDAIAFLADRRQFESMREEIETIVAASRPRCVLCGTPLTSEPHFCPPSNGHASFHEE